MKEIPVSCNRDCGGGCPLTAEVEGGKIIRIRNSRQGSPYMKGCIKGFRAAAHLDHPDRLKTPLIRRSFESRQGIPRRPFTSAAEARSLFREASWPEALELAAAEMAGLEASYGKESLLALPGSGDCRGVLHNSGRLLRRFLGLWGGYTGTVGFYSDAAVSFTAPFLLGTNETGFDPAALEDTAAVILWGANIVATRFGCELPSRIAEARRRGAPVLVIDPRKTRTVRALGTEHLAPRPGTDSALMAAVITELDRAALLDEELIARTTSGFPELRARLRGETDGQPRDAAWAAGICGLEESQILRIRDLYAAMSPVCLIPGLSLQRALHGEETVRMAVTLQAVTGNLGLSGGSSGANIWDALPGPRCGAVSARSRGPVPRFPVYRWPDAILEGPSGGWPSQIRGSYNAGHNLVSQGSDTHKSIRAFQSLEVNINHDLFLTPTGALCDIVFPVQHWLEREDIIQAPGPYLLFSQRAAPPPEGVLSDFQIFSRLAAALGFGEAFTAGRSESEWLAHLLSESEIEDHHAFRRQGLYVGPEQKRTAFCAFRRSPEENPLGTPSGRVEILSAALEEAGGSRLPEFRSFRELGPSYPLHLITPHSAFRIHSQHQNITEAVKAEPQVLTMNSRDAAPRGITSGDRVVIESPRGKTSSIAVVGNDIRPGTVSLPEGGWPELTPWGDGGGAPNTLSTTEPTRPSSGSRTHSIAVQVRREEPEESDFIEPRS